MVIPVKELLIFFGWLLIFGFSVTIVFCVFFDQAVFSRQGTIYRLNTKQKKIVLTFDDGPSPVWTPLILDELKKAKIRIL